MLKIARQLIETQNIEFRGVWNHKINILRFKSTRIVFKKGFFDLSVEIPFLDTIPVDRHKIT